MRRAMMRYVTTAVLLGMVAVEHADAEFISYTQTATGSGSLGGTVFTNAAITYTQIADTNNVISLPGFFSVQALSSTFTVAGIGSGSFTTPTFVASQVGIGVGLGQGQAGAGGPVVIAVSNTVGGIYDLRTSIGPLSGTANFTPIAFSTSAGQLLVTAYAGNGTFQAVGGSAAIPEPSSLALCGIASVAGLGVARLRRHRLAA